MARVFNIKEAEDKDLNLLVDRFLNQRPDFMPVTGCGGTLILLPCTDCFEYSEDFYLCPETLASSSEFEMLPVKTELLM